MSRSRSRFPAARWRAWLAAIACAGLTFAARGAPMAFDLPAQPAGQALLALAKQAGVEVLFSSRELNAVQSQAVADNTEPAQAIERLLQGTGFCAMPTAPGKFVVVAERRAAAQGELRGTVLRRADGRPVAGASIRVAGSSVAATSDAEGRFVLSGVPVEARMLAVLAEGFVPVRLVGIAARAGAPVELEPVRLVADGGAQQLEEVVVNARDLGGASPVVALEKFVVTPSRFGLEEERGPVAAVLTESDLLALPQLAEDLYRAISHLPGLAADDMTARFWVRGAPHEQVLARLDGVDLIEPFHLKDTDSSLSILDIDTIDHLDLYTGGFTAEYGERSAGVLTMETDSHARARPRTTLGVSLTGARAASRGQTASGRGRWLASARVGYPDLALQAKDVNDSGDMRPRYYDLMGKWEAQLTPDQVLSVHALHAGDQMYFKDATGPVLRSRYASDYFWLRWRGDFGRVSTEAVASGKWISWHRDGSGANEQHFALEVKDDRDLGVYGLRQEATVRLSERALLRGGVEATTGAAHYDYRGAHDWLALRDGAVVPVRNAHEASASPEGQTLGGYFTARLQPVPVLTLEPGVRYDTNDYAGDAALSPRLGAALSLGRTTWRAAWGYYHQAQGLHELAAADGDVRFYRAERAEHRVLSVEHRFKSGLSLRLEGYERIVANPRPHWENAVDSFSAVAEVANDRLQLVPVRMNARGVELIAEQRSSRQLTWSASYAWARSEETLADGRTIPRLRDQRHTVYLDVTYTPNPRWQFSAAWQYHTGWPVSELTYTLVPLKNGGNALVSDVGGLYALRAPDYLRLDFRVQRRIELRRGTLRVYLDVFNAFNRRNALNYGYRVDFGPNGSFTVERRTGDTLFPIMPNLGAVWDF